MKRLLVTLLLVLAAAFDPLYGSSRGSRFYAGFAGGVTIPYLSNLSSELEAQGSETLDPGYGLAAFLGRSFHERRWAVEAYFSLSRFPDFHYVNEHEDFEGKLIYYGFALMAKRCLLPESETITPFIGIGAGYGTTSLVEGGAKLATYEALAAAEVEYRLRDNISIIAEGLFTYALKVKRYTSPFLEASDLDVIFDSSGEPLDDRYTSFSARLGVKFWLRPVHD